MLFFDGRHRNLMPYLKRLREYPGGAESAKALAESWKTEYKRRPAMAKNLFGYARQKACYPSICTISHAARCSSSIRVKQNFSHGDNVVSDGSLLRIFVVVEEKCRKPLKIQAFLIIDNLHQERQGLPISAKTFK